MIVRNELLVVTIWKEVFMAPLKIPFHHLLGGTEENHRIANDLAEI
jgi:hypothetical protein